MGKTLNKTQYVASNIPGDLRMLDVVRNSLDAAFEIAISASFFRYSGFALVVDNLKSFVGRGGQIRILTSTYLGITQPEALNQLLKIEGVECRIHIAGFSGIRPVKESTGFHTKIYIFKKDQRECWVGSSNFTKGGFSSNIEANMYQNDPVAVSAVENLFETLWNRTDVVPLNAELISNYSRARLQIESPRNQLSRLSTQVEYAAENPPQQTGHVPNQAQIEAMVKLNELRKLGETRAAVIAAPGIGKTYLAAFDVQQVGAKSILFLSHRLEHLSQARKTFISVFGTKRSYGRVLASFNESKNDFIFATVQSAISSPTLMSRSFDYVVFDEFHHADAPSYKRLIDALSTSFLLGLTATPERQDGHDVLKLCNYNIAYEIRLVEAINRGWLIPFHYFGIHDSLVDYDAIPWRSGSFVPEELENALMLEERVNEILKHALEKGFDGKRRATVGFCAGVKHAQFMAKAFQKRGQTAVAITGEDSLADREQVYERLSNPENSLEWLFVADVLNEGVDIPAINSILFLRPTESATIFIQQLGRGLRTSPHCEVLTVLDFVGHHKSAWLPLQALNDQNADLSESSIDKLEFTPPRNCEVILDQKTLEIIEKIKRHIETKRELCLKGYATLQAEIARPYPLDLWARADCPEFGIFRITFGSWINLRRAANDLLPWEGMLEPDSKVYRFLSILEKDWQQQRVYAYALVWGLCRFPKSTPTESYQQFFEQFPRWSVEYKPLEETGAWATLRKELGTLLSAEKIDSEIFESIPADFLMDEIEGRIRITLEKDFKIRHGGILKQPSDLELHRTYSRPEIVNYFGVQYDPAIHNRGFVEFGKEIAIITKLDTSDALPDFQFSNKFVDPQTFHWQSQNRQRQDNDLGKLILNHAANGITMHLFVQTRSHERAYYCGTVLFVEVEGNAPMNVTFKLLQPLSDSLFEMLGDK